MTKRQKFFSALGQFLKNVFTRNILLKVVALVFALLLWGYVLSEAKPKYVKRVIDVSVDYQNEDRLKKGWEVVSIDPPSVDVNVEAGIDMHSKLDKSSVSCYVDLGNILTSDQDPDRKEIELDILTKIPTYGELKSLSSKRAKVTIERVKSSEKINATVKIKGSLPEIVKVGDTLKEYYECIPPKQVTVQPITGLKSDIDKIYGAEVTLDLSSFSGDTLSVTEGIYSRILPVTFLDEKGNAVVSSATKDVVVNVEDIVIRRYKEVPIVLDVSDEGIDASVYQYSCGIKEGEPEKVRIYGSASELAKVQEIKTETIYLESEEGRKTVRAELVLPEDSKVNMEQATTEVEITVEKREVRGEEYEIPVKYTNPDEGMQLAEKTETIKIKVSGLADAMSSFKAEWFTASVDLARCGEGKQALPFKLLFKGVDLHVQTYLIEEQREEGEPAIRITFVAKDGATYVIELESNTVEVVLNSLLNETNG
jgi:hypothetical protein